MIFVIQNSFLNKKIKSEWVKPNNICIIQLVKYKWSKSIAYLFLKQTIFGSICISIWVKPTIIIIQTVDIQMIEKIIKMKINIITIPFYELQLSKTDCLNKK